MQRLKNNDRGQSGTIVALVLVPIMAMLALALDVGAMHLAKQQLQTGADASALAVAQDCAHGDCGAYNDTATSLTQANFRLDGPVTAQAAPNMVDQTVTVQAQATHHHWFAPIIGIHSSDIQVSATAEWTDHTYDAPIFPMAFSVCALSGIGGANPAAYGDETGPNTTEVLLDARDADCKHDSETRLPGGFGWLDLPGDSCGTVTWDANGWAPSQPGNSSPCDNSYFAQFLHQPIILPIFDAVRGQGANGALRISGFATFTMTGYRFGGDRSPDAPTCSNAGPCIRGTYDRYVSFADGDSATSIAGAPVVTLTH